jgi:hypothetical protein
VSPEVTTADPALLTVKFTQEESHDAFDSWGFNYGPAAIAVVAGLTGTTGGFVSMIDNAAVKQTTLHRDTYDSKFDQRLSSAVVEMSTRPEGPVGYHANSEFGIGGTGGSFERPLGTNGSLFVGARRSILNWLTDNIGMNGVPIYTNGLVRADKRVDEKNNWCGISRTYNSIDNFAHIISCQANRSEQGSRVGPSLQTGCRSRSRIVLHLLIQDETSLK